jgi:hypothetical protein
MIIPIICFAIAAFLLILLVVINVRAQSSRKEKALDEELVQEEHLESSDAKHQIADESTIPKAKDVIEDEASVLEAEQTAEIVNETETEQAKTETILNEEETVSQSIAENQETKPFKIEDSSYREALKKFQAKKPELANKKKQISDSDYRSALRSMQKKHDQK